MGPLETSVPAPRSWPWPHRGTRWSPVAGPRGRRWAAPSRSSFSGS